MFYYSIQLCSIILFSYVLSFYSVMFYSIILFSYVLFYHSIQFYYIILFSYVLFYHSIQFYSIILLSSVSILSNLSSLLSVTETNQYAHWLVDIWGRLPLLPCLVVVTPGSGTGALDLYLWEDMQSCIEGFRDEWSQAFLVYSELFKRYLSEVFLGGWAWCVCGSLIKVKAELIK